MNHQLLLAGAAALLMSSTALAGTPAEDFAAADANKSGTLDAVEFRAFINLSAAAGRKNAVMVRNMGVYDRAFAKLDQNRDGQLSPAELDPA
jgi:hypothetical protein